MTRDIGRLYFKIRTISAAAAHELKLPARAPDASHR
jgi:hypothetical protein